ncbi:MAG: glycoside hydrolase family 88 protein [Chloroflexi bacterium]|nr:glycoside hydrolase family 88 protein [Chloroflexota bacterium]
MVENASRLTAELRSLAQSRPEMWRLSACGVTPSELPIRALVHVDAYAPDTPRARLLLVAGLTGEAKDVELTLDVLRRVASAREGPWEGIALSAIPCANRDGLGLGPENDAGGRPSTGYPPEGGFFGDPTNPESRYLWRWIGFQAPDLVVELAYGEGTVWEVNEAAADLAPALAARDLAAKDGLLAALGTGTPNGLGVIPGVRLTCSPTAVDGLFDRLNAELRRRPTRPSAARTALDARRTRSPLQVARALAAVYGHSLEPVVYTQGVAISGRLRLAALDGTASETATDVKALVEGLTTRGDDAFGSPPETASMAGVLWADELARATEVEGDSDVLPVAARLYRPRGEGQPPWPADEDFRVEDMFFAGAVLGRAFAVTGDNAYVDMLADFIVATPTQQSNGLFWHCLSAPHFWGRGNGFAAMGLAETLTYLPTDHPKRPAVLAMFRQQMEALPEFQEQSGMYRQVLDFLGSYQEHTATCMIGYAMARGIRLGWLDSSYGASLSRAWQAVSERTDNAGNVVDGCTGTGVQSSLRDYLDREAISGFDHRTGSMALWFAVEMERLSRQG